MLDYLLLPVLKKYRCEADITVDKRGRGDYMDVEKAVAAAMAVPKQKSTIQILGGEWVKPQLPKNSKLQLVMREGAAWTNGKESK